jgi:hypothetical protein
VGEKDVDPSKSKKKRAQKKEFLMDVDKKDSMFTAENEAVYMKRKAGHDARYASSKSACHAHSGSFWVLFLFLLM